MSTIPRPVNRRVAFTLSALLAALVASLVGVLGAAGTVSAHATLQDSSPPANAVLTDAPTSITLTFDEGVNKVDDSIRLVAADGTAIALGAVTQDDTGAVLTAQVPTLTNGTYVVAWKAISDDSHPVSGAFTFTVGTPTTTNPNLVNDLLTSNRPGGSNEVWLGVGRAASFLGLALLLGGALAATLFVPGAIDRRRTGNLLYAGAIIGVLGTMLMIAAQATIVAHSWWAWRSVWNTTSGMWWFVRLAIFVLAIGVIAVRTRLHGRRWETVLLVYAGVGLAAVVAAGGHSATGRWLVVGFIATVVHLLAMSIWAGGLFLIGISPIDQLWRGAARFSPWALGSVVALSVTGTVNAWRQSESFAAQRNSTYGAWLLAKLVIIAAVVSIAAVSRWLTNHHQQRAIIATDTETEADVDADADTASATEAGAEAATEISHAEISHAEISHAEISHAEISHAKISHDGALRRTVLAEALGIIIVLAATAGLGNSPPPRVANAPAVASATAVQGTRIAQLTLDPAVSGGTTVHVYITNSSGTVEQPTEITVTATLTAKQVGPIGLTLQTAGPGHLTGSGVVLPLPGTWTFEIVARYSNFDATTFSLDLTVK